jgi:hypothetical protein
MSQRRIEIVCPSCGHVRPHILKAQENIPTVQLVTCESDSGGCGRPFAVEVRLTVQIEYSTCRLMLPSTQAPTGGAGAWDQDGDHTAGREGTGERDC